MKHPISQSKGQMDGKHTHESDGWDLHAVEDWRRASCDADATQKYILRYDTVILPDKEGR